MNGKTLYSVKETFCLIACYFKIILIINKEKYIKFDNNIWEIKDMIKKYILMKKINYLNVRQNKKFNIKY